MYRKPIETIRLLPQLERTIENTREPPKRPASPIVIGRPAGCKLAAVQAEKFSPIFATCITRHKSGGLYREGAFLLRWIEIGAK